MIVHSITIHSPKWVPKNERRRNAIFERSLRKLDPNTYFLGQNFKVKGTPVGGTLIYICKNIDEAEWDGMKLKFLELWISDTQLVELYHPSDLEVLHA